jgi:streptogramin lyase
MRTIIKAIGLFAAAACGAAGVVASAPQAQKALRVLAAPGAIAMSEGGQAAVLMSDGRITAIDTSAGRLGRDIYQVPDGFDALDIASGRTKQGPVMCFTVNPRSGRRSSYILQVFRDGREVWAYLSAPGVYVGITLDAENGVAYTTNGSNNVVYRVALGREKGSVTELATLSKAAQIGALSVDVEGRRLFVADLGLSVMHVVPLDRAAPRSIRLPEIRDVRALAWNAPERRLYMADSAREVVWSLDPASGAVQPAFRDRRFKTPSGLAFAPDGSLWMVDEIAVAAFQLSTADRRVVRALSWRRLD